MPGFEDFDSTYYVYEHEGVKPVNDTRTHYHMELVIEQHEHFITESNYLTPKTPLIEKSARNLVNAVTEPTIEKFAADLAFTTPPGAEVEEQLHHTSSYVYHDHHHYISGLEAGSVFWADVPN